MALKASLDRVVIQNYKSIAACDVELQPLTILVGPNGSGKSNFLDALRFVSDCLRYSVEQAIRDRGGIQDLRRRSEGRPHHFGVKLEFRINRSKGQFAFELGDRKGGGFSIKREEFRLLSAGHKGIDYRVENGKLELRPNPWELKDAPPDRFMLQILAGLPGYSDAHRFLSSMAFYKLNPDRIRDLQPQESGELLLRDGANCPAVLGFLTKHHADIKERIQDYLSRVAPGTRKVETKLLGFKETLEFSESIEGIEKPRKFYAASMSDGTLRALGVLLALFQSPNGRSLVSLIGIEEPEVALHPGAAGVLLDCLHEAAAQRQVIVTSHSPDLLDRHDFPVNSILAVAAERGLPRSRH